MYYCSLFIVISSVLYLRVLPVSPVYILLIISIVYTALKIKVNNDELKLFSIMFLVLLIFTGYQALELSKVSMLINTYLSFIVFIFLYISLNKLDVVTIQNIARKYIIFCVFIVSIETLYRFLNPIYLSLDNLSGLEVYMYPFKRNSLMFVDSNYTSILLITNLILFNLGVLKISKNRFLYLLLFILLILTFSRASILSYVLITLIYLFLGFFKKNKLLIILFFIFFVSFFLYFKFVIYSGTFSIHDGSLNSKFRLLNMMIDNVYDNGITFLLFGGGIGNAGDYLDGIGAHNIFVLIFTEYGLLFAIFMLVFFIITTVKSKFKILPFWLVMLATGQALGFFLAFVFIPVAFCLSFNKKE